MAVLGDEPHIVVSVSGGDALGGFKASRHINPHLQGEDLRVALWNGASAAIGHAMQLHEAHIASTEARVTAPYSTPSD